jgi:hypothetical protein
MALTTFVIVFLIGATLSVRFKALILVLAIGLAMVGVALAGIAHGDHAGAVMLTIALIAAALQMGYVVGLFTRAAILSLGMPNRKALRAGAAGVNSSTDW